MDKIVNIGQSIHIKGELTGNEDLTIEGKVEGKVFLKDHNLTVGANGKIVAEVQAKTVMVLGEVTGNITAYDKVEVAASISGLQPNQEHGFHIHEKGDCSSGDGMSAGGHFNPLGKPHAHPSTSDRHAGDMQALKADDYGNASYSATFDVITVTEGPTGIIGRGVIVHAQADDYKTQPTGNAGARLACGVIQKG